MTWIFTLKFELKGCWREALNLDLSIDNEIASISYNCGGTVFWMHH